MVLKLHNFGLLNSQIMKRTLAMIFVSSFSLLGYTQTEQAIIRKGFVFGVSFGISGTMQTFPDKSQNDLDFGLDLKLGYMIKPDLAILLTSNVSGYDYSGIGRTRKRDFGVLAPSVQYWFHERFWFLGGAGIGLDAPVFFDIKEPETNKEETIFHSGFGVIAAVGHDIYRSKKLTIDVKARLTYRNLNILEGRTTGISPSILVGINFY